MMLFSQLLEYPSPPHLLVSPPLTISSLLCLMDNDYKAVVIKMVMKLLFEAEMIMWFGREVGKRDEIKVTLSC